MSNSKTVNNKVYIESEELSKLAESVIKNEGLDLMGASVRYVVVYPHISKNIAGKCSKTSTDLKFFSGCDYLIKMSGDLWDQLDDETQYILMYHELLHIHPVNNEKKERVDYKIRDHNVKDFYQLISKYKIDWLEKVRVTNASIYDMDESQASINL